MGRRSPYSLLRARNETWNQQRLSIYQAPFQYNWDFIDVYEEMVPPQTAKRSPQTSGKTGHKMHEYFFMILRLIYVAIVKGVHNR